jgi:acylphosphatase
MRRFQIAQPRSFMSEVQHETVYFSGHVQGVGFRYATLEVAKEYEVAGFVRNLPDGRVHMEVEGMKPEIEAFLKGVGEAMPGYIREMERRSARREPQFRGFSIR